MPETRVIRGGVVPSTSYPGGRGHHALEDAIVRPSGTATRTVTVLAGAAEWAVVANDGSVGAYTAVAQGATKTVTAAAAGAGVFFRPTGNAATLLISDPV